MQMKDTKKNFFAQCGSSLIEVILTIALVLMIMPLMYNQIADMNNSVKNIAMSKRIIKVEDDVLNYVRLNKGILQGENPHIITTDVLSEIAPLAHGGFINKNEIHNGNNIVTDIYLAFNLDGGDYNTSEIAKYIGADAAVVHDGVARGQNWSVTVPNNFNTGDLVYKIRYDFGSDEKSNYLHRGDAVLSNMERDLDMNGHSLFNVGDINGVTIEAYTGSTGIIKTDNAEDATVAAYVGYFLKNLTMQTGLTVNGDFQVKGDISGFKSISAYELQGTGELAIAGLDVFEELRVKSTNLKTNNLTLSVAGGGSVTGLASLQIDKGNLYASYINVGTFSTTGNVRLSNDAILHIGDGTNNWKYPDAKNPKVTLNNLIVNGKDVKIVLSTPNPDSFGYMYNANWNAVTP